MEIREAATLLLCKENHKFYQLVWPISLNASIGSVKNWLEVGGKGAWREERWRFLSDPPIDMWCKTQHYLVSIITFLLPQTSTTSLNICEEQQHSQYYFSSLCYALIHQSQKVLMSRAWKIQWSSSFQFRDIPPFQRFTKLSYMQLKQMKTMSRVQVTIKVS